MERDSVELSLSLTRTGGNKRPERILQFRVPACALAHCRRSLVLYHYRLRACTTLCINEIVCKMAFAISDA